MLDSELGGNFLILGHVGFKYDQFLGEYCCSKLDKSQSLGTEEMLGGSEYLW